MKKIEGVWEEVQKKLGYPNLKIPSIVDGDEHNVGTAQINMITKEILISKQFIEELNMPIEHSYKAISAHEANHYVTCPFDFHTMLMLDLEANKANPKYGNELSNYFQDVVINLDLLSRGITEIAEVYTNMDSDHKMDETVRALYSLLTGLDFGIRDIRNVDKIALKKISKLDYKTLSLESLKKNTYEFSKIMSSILEDDLNNKPEQPLMLIDSNNINNYDSSYIDEALNGCANNILPSEYRVIRSSIDASENEFTSIMKYYETLADKYTLQVKDVKTPQSTRILNYSSKEWSLSENINDYDPYKSAGKFIPGLSKKKSYEEILFEFENKKSIDIYSNSNALPNALIAIDSSSSMNNPFKEKSNAVIGSFIVAKYYLKKHKKVAVQNFSSKTITTPFSKNKLEILRTLLYYQGENTYFDVNELSKTIENTFCDIYIFTDSFIENEKELYKKLEKTGHTKRVNLFVTGNKPPKKFKNISIYPVTDESDFTNIIINTLNEYNKT